VPILLPALRERADDIEALAKHFLTAAAAEGLPRRHLASEAVELLKRQPWRGNVRELRNFIYRLALLAREDRIDAAALEPMLASAMRSEETTPSGDLAGGVAHWLIEHKPAAGTIYDTALAAFETPLFAEILRQTGGNQLRAAQMLGINRNTLRKRLSELAIDPDGFFRRP
jgi:two-component system nitrogen regulation response regulator GlnG